MVTIRDIETTQVMSLDEYVDYVQRHVDVRDYDSIEESAWALRALAGNRSFILDAYHAELKLCATGSTPNEHLPQSIRLHSERDFYVRSNIWLPVTSDDIAPELQRLLYAYDMAHDHNFTFVTVGYFGPGYQTDLYQYEYSKVQGYQGERVELESQGRHQLTPGRTMVYRAGKDIHVQRLPAEVSISLNLMCVDNSAKPTQQFIFDVEKGVLARGAGDETSSRLSLLALLKRFNNDDTPDILDTVLTNHPCERTRASALNVLKEIRPADVCYFEAKASARVRALSDLPLAYGNGSRDYSRA